MGWWPATKSVGWPVTICAVGDVLPGGARAADFIGDCQVGLSLGSLALGHLPTRRARGTYELGKC